MLTAPQLAAQEDKVWILLCDSMVYILQYLAGMAFILFGWILNL